MLTQKRILFLVPYPLRNAPSQRFRVENFLPLLERNGLSYKVSPFLDEDTYRILYKKGSLFRKVTGFGRGFLRRLKMILFEVRHFDYVFIHRETSPAGPPVFEWIIAKLLKKRIIYDFDDALWIPEGYSKLLNWIKAPWKIKWICTWAYKVAGGNDYLCAYAHNYNKGVVLLPTCVDTINQHNRLKQQKNDKVVIGWTGSHSTLRYLTPFVPLLEQLTKEHDALFLVICNKPPAFTFPGLRFVLWNEATEVDDLLKMNIGIMPLEADKWSEGKCGFKLIQYLALGIPAVASPVGVNSKIVDESVNGVFCTYQEEWKTALKALILDGHLRQRMGEFGRQKIVSDYSIQANEARFLGLFE